MFMGILMLMLVLSAEADSIIQIDAVVDLLLEAGMQHVKSAGWGRIAIPDLDKHLEFSVIGSTLDLGFFVAKLGTAGDMSSIKRTGAVTMRRKDNEVVLTTEVGFGLLDFEFRNYTLELLTSHSTGAIRAESTSSSMTITVMVYHTPGYDNCSVNIPSAEITDAGTFSLNMTGSGDQKKTGSTVLVWLLDHFNKSIRKLVNRHVECALRIALENRIEHFMCDKFLFQI